MLIDREQRRAELAEAVWQVISHKGVSAVSLRAVAARAGLSTGSLRHVFPSKGELLAFSMELVHQRFAERFEVHHRAEKPDLVAWLSELLPLDDERRLEMDVNLALLGDAGTDPELLRMREATAAGIHQVCRTALEHPGVDPVLRTDLDLDREVPRLAVTIDGLAFQLRAQIDELTPRHAVEMLTEHIGQLATTTRTLGEP
ncbi:MAG: TetR/AcrR family transcriptional regulator [Stackebrandtia sp.]